MKVEETHAKFYPTEACWLMNLLMTAVCRIFLKTFVYILTTEIRVREGRVIQISEKTEEKTTNNKTK